jgi:hypothetical protein
MKIFIALNCLFFLLFVSGCTTEYEENIPPNPVVKKTSGNYTNETFKTSFPDTISLHSISKTYRNNYTEDKRNKLLDYMRSKVSKLGEDSNIFENILSQTGCKLTGEYVLPTYAERAKYKNQEVWIFQITIGLGGPDFSHWKCFVLSLTNLDTLAYIGCR